MWDLPKPGIEPMSPALAGGFLTTGSPGKSSYWLFLKLAVLNIHWRDWCWSWNSITLATWCEELTHWERPWCWERLKVGGGGDDRGWDGWMASPTQWTWVWVNSGRWWWTGSLAGCSPCGLKESDATELNWSIYIVPDPLLRAGHKKTIRYNVYTKIDIW